MLWQGRYSQAGRDLEREKEESRRCHVTDKGDRLQNLTGRPYPHGDTQINKNGLI